MTGNGRNPLHSQVTSTSSQVQSYMYRRTIVKAGQGRRASSSPTRRLRFSVMLTLCALQITILLLLLLLLLIGAFKIFGQSLKFGKTLFAVAYPRYQSSIYHYRCQIFRLKCTKSISVGAPPQTPLVGLNLQLSLSLSLSLTGVEGTDSPAGQSFGLRYSSFFGQNYLSPQKYWPVSCSHLKTISAFQHISFNTFTELALFLYSRYII